MAGAAALPATSHGVGDAPLPEAILPGDQVHRGSTLNRITNTNAGALGADFWPRI